MPTSGTKFAKTSTLWQKMPSYDPYSIKYQRNSLHWGKMFKMEFSSEFCLYCTQNGPGSYLGILVPIKGIVQQFGKYSYSLSSWELDEKININFMSVLKHPCGWVIKVSTMTFVACHSVSLSPLISCHLSALKAQHAPKNTCSLCVKYGGLYFIHRLILTFSPHSWKEST